MSCSFAVAINLNANFNQDGTLIGFHLRLHVGVPSICSTLYPQASLSLSVCACMFRRGDFDRIIAAATIRLSTTATTRQSARNFYQHDGKHIYIPVPSPSERLSFTEIEIKDKLPEFLSKSEVFRHLNLKFRSQIMEDGSNRLGAPPTMGSLNSLQSTEEVDVWFIM